METGIGIQGKDTENWGFPDGSVVKNMPAMQETQVRSLGWEGPLEEVNGNPLQHLGLP